MARRLAFINEKGGSCKTTLAVSTASYLAERLHKKVLLLDGDPQGQAGKCLGLDVMAPGATLADLLRRPEEAVKAGARRPTSVRGLDVVVANKGLAEVAAALLTRPDRESVLRRIVDTMEEAYDYVIFDSPPSLGLLSTGIMLAVHELVIPVPLTFLAMDGCAEMLDTVDALRERTGHDVEVALMVGTLYRPTRLADEILEKLRSHFGPLVAKTVIGYSVKVDEAQSHGRTIWDYAPASSGAQTMGALAQELVKRGSPAAPRKSRRAAARA